MHPGRLLTILGPTASGKSAVAMTIAEQLNAEIVSCDSMQIYCRLDIGTAKPTPDEQARTPHHLVDFLELDEPYNAGRFVLDADAAIRDILARGRRPILCGGTGLYAKALLYGFNMWPTDKAVAAQLRTELQEHGEDPLRAELCAASDELYERLTNPRHWLRALEVIRITGQPPTSQMTFNPPDYAAPEYILMPSAELSRQRIHRRTQHMLANGWIDEVREVGIDTLRQSPTAKQALGYILIADFLESGSTDLDGLCERLVTLTARYAKRQRTWFRHQHPNSVQIPVESHDTAHTLATRILSDETFSTTNA